MKITITEVAKDADVSLGTVSNVLHNNPCVNSAIREKVLGSIKKLGFVPNESAQRLKKNAGTSITRTRAIGIIVYAGFNRYKEPDYADIIEGIHVELTKQDYILLFYNKLEELVLNPVLCNKLINSEKIDGLITISSQLEGIEGQVKTKIKNIISLGEPLGFGPYDYVVFDVRKGVLDAVGYLSGLGHKRIAFVGNELGKLAFFREAMNSLGLPIDEKLVEADCSVVAEGNVKISENFECGKALMSRVLDRADKIPTAVFSPNDLATAGVIQAIKEKGFRIPDDISVIGFGDSMEILAEMDPPLTTMALDRQGVGALVVRKLLERINNPETITSKTSVPFHLIVRGSCKGIKES